jgi:hypothetical protein
MHADTMYKWAPDAKDYYMAVCAEIDAEFGVKE